MSTDHRARSAKRAIAIVRVSQVAGREGDSFASPSVQIDRIRAACERDGLRLVETHEELDVSGGKPLDQRPGLSAAVAAVEAGKADVIAAAYFDRLFRSLTTQAEVIERVERAGGQVLAVDVGQITNGSASQWLSGTLHGAMAEYYRRSVKERAGEAQARAIARGMVPWPNVPVGYDRSPDGILRPNAHAPLIAEAFQRRIDGASIHDLRAFLASRGVACSFHVVERMLRNRLYLGEIHFGRLINLHAHEPIVERGLFDQVQRTRIPRGRRAQSERLLARQGILRCSGCGRRMVLGSTRQSGKPRFPQYRCPTTEDCPRRVCIGAEIAERIVTDAVRDALRDVQGRASIAESAQEARSALEIAQTTLDQALRVFTLTGAENESAAVERIAALRQARDDAQARLDQITPAASSAIDISADWESLTIAGRRDLIRATIASATVVPGGRGAGRITVKLTNEAQ